jgi:hypothetical protein
VGGTPDLLSSYTRHDREKAERVAGSLFVLARLA